MRKLFAIILVVALIFCLVACSNNKDTAKQVKADYESYDWNKATPAAAKTKAEALLARINKLSATEQQEVKDIKVKLETIIAGSASPSPTATPSVSPTATPTPTPSTTASAITVW